MGAEESKPRKPENVEETTSVDACPTSETLLTDDEKNSETSTESPLNVDTPKKSLDLADHMANLNSNPVAHATENPTETCEADGGKPDSTTSKIDSPDPSMDTADTISALDKHQDDGIKVKGTVIHDINFQVNKTSDFGVKEVSADVTNEHNLANEAEKVSSTVDDLPLDVSLAARQDADVTTVNQGSISDGLVTDKLLLDDSAILEIVKAIPHVEILEQKSEAASSGWCRVYVIGAAHVSKESVDNVRHLIQTAKPELVFLELCNSRPVIASSKASKKFATLSDVLSAISKDKSAILHIIWSYLLHKTAEKSGAILGEEFAVAVQEAELIGATVFYGDRPIKVTFQRAWDSMSSWQRFKLLAIFIGALFDLPGSEGIGDIVEDIKDENAMDAIIDDLGGQFPPLIRSLVHERDLYMTAKLRSLASKSTSSIVAVVGRGHQSGIVKNWETEDIDIDSLLVVKKNCCSPILSGRVTLGICAVAVSGLVVFLVRNLRK